MKVSRDSLVAALLDQNFYMLGDTDCGVSLYCRPCWDGGRPIAYYSTEPETNPYLGDNRVAKPATIPALIASAAQHRAEHHPEVEEVRADARA